MDPSVTHPLQPAEVLHSQTQRGTVWRSISIIIGWVGLIAAIVWSVNAGVNVRKWAWDSTTSIRFVFDIGNGYNQGERVFRSMTKMARAEHRPAGWGDFFSAYLNNYSDVTDHAVNGNYGLDYAPARLLVMSLWVKHLHESNPPIHGWNAKYETTAPLLRFNTACEALSAVAMFGLVRHWRRARAGRSILPHWRHPWREWPAVLAGMAVWLNPALIWNAHVWPQWDCWLLPFFLWGVLAASKDKWLIAGFILLAGASFKGQVLMILPVILLWPILIGRPLAALRLIIGGGAFAALMALPWMIHTNTAIAWLVVIFIAATTSAILFGTRRKFDRIGIVTAVIMALMIVPIMIRADYAGMYRSALLLMIVTAVLPRWVPGKWLPVLVLAAMAFAVFLAGFAFEGRFDWFEIGYLYPQRHYPRMVMSGANLASILSSYGWNLGDTVMTWPASVMLVLFIAVVGIIGVLFGLSIVVPWLVVLVFVPPLYWRYLQWFRAMTSDTAMIMRTFLITLFGVSLALCSIGTAVRARLRSPLMLISIAAPWVVFFAVMPQMHERYLLWGAVVMCAGFGVSVGDALLAIAVTYFAWANMAAPTLPNDPTLSPGLSTMLRGMMPGSAWGVVFLAVLCLYAGVMPRGRRFGDNAPPVDADDDAHFDADTVADIHAGDAAARAPGLISAVPAEGIPT